MPPTVALVIYYDYNKLNRKKICKFTCNQNRYFFNYIYNVNYMHLRSGPKPTNTQRRSTFMILISYGLITGIDEQVLNL